MTFQTLENFRSKTRFLWKSAKIPCSNAKSFKQIRGPRISGPFWAVSEPALPDFRKMGPRDLFYSRCRGLFHRWKKLSPRGMILNSLSKFGAGQHAMKLRRNPEKHGFWGVRCTEGKSIPIGLRARCHAYVAR